ncbi:DUF1761 domain-containing protein [Patescibacteria group bacterium]|nr:DUF1761 domain-containing protein [Patescibacteria group bacterium]
MLYFALFFSVAVSFFLGYLWYGPLFGTLWNTNMGFASEYTEKQKTTSKKKVVLFNIFSQIVITLVLFSLLQLVGITSLVGAIEIMILVWVGIAVPIGLEPVLWDNKPWIIFFINTSYRLVSYLCTAIILIVIAQ